VGVPERLLAVDGLKKKRARYAADAVAVYGFPPGRRVSYSLWVGLYLNVRRVRLQRAWQAAQGHTIARSGGPLAFAWFDATSLDESEATPRAFEVNAARFEAQALRRKGGEL
jgi:hypothetical protein